MSLKYKQPAYQPKDNSIFSTTKRQRNIVRRSNKQKVRAISAEERHALEIYSSFIDGASDTRNSNYYSKDSAEWNWDKLRTDYNAAKQYEVKKQLDEQEDWKGYKILINFEDCRNFEQNISTILNSIILSVGYPDSDPSKFCSELKDIKLDIQVFLKFNSEHDDMSLYKSQIALLAYLHDAVQDSDDMYHYDLYV